MYVFNYTPHLAHHGIKGQRWGVKNGPPYPLDAAAHSRAEKKAGWRSSLGKHSDNGKFTMARLDNWIDRLNYEGLKKWVDFH